MLVKPYYSTSNYGGGFTGKTSIGGRDQVEPASSNGFRQQGMGEWPLNHSSLRLGYLGGGGAGAK